MATFNQSDVLATVASYEQAGSISATARESWAGSILTITPALCRGGIGGNWLGMISEMRRRKHHHTPISMPPLVSYRCHVRTAHPTM